MNNNRQPTNTREKENFAFDDEELNAPFMDAKRLPNQSVLNQKADQIQFEVFRP